MLQGPIPHGKGWAWFDLDPALRSTSSTREDISRARHLVVEKLRSLELPLDRVVLGGFSQGCVVSLETGLREDIPLAGILGISGYVPLLEDYPQALGPRASTRRILATFGHWDQYLQAKVAREQFESLAAHGAPVELEMFDKGHTVDLDDEVPRIRGWLEGCLVD